MTALLEKLIDFLVQWFWHLAPFVVMGDDQCGIVRRLGKFTRTLHPGVNWKVPLIEMSMTENAALGSMTLREQTLTTKDGVQLTLRGVLTWRPVDARAYILGCDNAQSVVNDVGACVVAETVPNLAAEELLNGHAKQALEKAMRSRARKWGIRVESFGLVDCVRTRAYRIITSAPIDLPGG